MSDEKRQFFTKLGKKEDLSNYKKAYIIILILGFFELSEGGIVDFYDLAYNFREFYRSRKEKGFSLNRIQVLSYKILLQRLSEEQRVFF